MIFTEETLRPQLSSMLQLYPQLYIVSQETDTVTVSGTIFVYIKHLGFSVRKNYDVDINIYLNSDRLPCVVDRNGYISKKYQHIYSDGKLCLETDTKIRLRFADGFDLVAWMKEFVESYFFSYEYFMRYDSFPFGERSHGLEGIVQTYQDIFKTKDYVETLKIMAYVHSKKYRGHIPCPCGSEVKMRDCHGEQMIPLFNSPVKREILKKDYIFICEEVKKYEQNKKQTK